MKTVVRTVAKMKTAWKWHHMLLKCLAMRLKSHEKSKIPRSQGAQSANGPLKKEKTMTYLTVVFAEWSSTARRMRSSNPNKLVTSCLRDTVGKYIALSELSGFLTHVICLVPSKMRGTCASALELGLRDLCGFWERTRGGKPSCKWCHITIFRHVPDYVS